MESSLAVNINKADPEALEAIIHIGPKRAEMIIKNRPYRDVHELSVATGLGGKRMKDIINQGLVRV